MGKPRDKWLSNTLKDTDLRNKELILNFCIKIAVTSVCQDSFVFYECGKKFWWAIYPYVFSGIHVFYPIRRPGLLQSFREGKTSKTKITEKSYFWLLCSKSQVLVINQRFERLDEKLETVFSRSDKTLQFEKEESQRSQENRMMVESPERSPELLAPAPQPSYPKVGPHEHQTGRKVRNQMGPLSSRGWDEDILTGQRLHLHD